MKQMNLLLALSFFLFLFNGLSAQEDIKDENKKELTISGEVMARSEFTHGYKTPVPMYLIQDEYNTPPNLFTNQRTRFNFGYKTDKVKFGIVLQDVRKWGDEKQLVANEDFATSVHQAWAEVFFTKEISLKAGRMELAYDDHRILGNVGWAPQARSHDLALFKYEGDVKVHLGLAYHGGPFTGDDAYKAMQFLWINGKVGDLGYSILAVNNGKQEGGIWYDGTNPNPATHFNLGVVEKNAYSQTMGTRLTYKMGALSFALNAYYQMGKNAAHWVDTKSLDGTGMDIAALNTAYGTSFKDKAGDGQEISAYNFSVGALYKVSDAIKVGFDYEMLSGNDLTDASRTDENAFAPLYGTNHKFNGWMDYFFVGNHGSSVGLQDFNLKVIYNNGPFFVKLIPHYFMLAGKGTYTDMDGNQQDLGALGTEIDIWAGYHIVPKVASIQFGYSHMLATESMYGLKGVTITNENGIGTNNWAWIMLSVKPQWKSN